MSKKLILDLDTGVDDALALAYALASPELELIGVTGTYGNVTVDTGVRNALAILELFGAEEVPVFAGPTHASKKDSFEVLPVSEFIHGKNGIGEAELPEPKGAVQDKPAVDFLIESVREYGDDLVIVPTGPSTTIAAAIDADPEFAKKAHLIIMGGALTVPGNVSPVAEANVNQDPEATDQMFRTAQDVTMIGLDVTLQTLLTYEDTKKWHDLGTAGGDFLGVATDFYIKSYETNAPHLGGCGLHDPLAVAVAADPSLVETFGVNLKVDTEGELRGRVIADETRLNDAEKTSRVALTVDTERFLGEFMERLTTLANNTGSRA